MIPTIAITRLAQRFEAGAIKYDRDNWRKGQPLSWHIDSGFRHLMAARDGRRDEDHPAACLCNLSMFMWTEDAIIRGALPPELDDLGICPTGA